MTQLTVPAGIAWSRFQSWLSASRIDLKHHAQLTYLPPLMVYMAAGISGLTGIAGTFYIKDALGLSAEFLAMLGFWAGMPWALKMPLGHLVDLMWRWKSSLVVLGAVLIAASLTIMLGLIGNTALMTSVLPVETWFVLAALLAPLGYVVQDVVADAMTVEAVPEADVHGQPYDAATLKRMHITMQTLGRAAVIGGGIAVALVNVVVLNGIHEMPKAAQATGYLKLYTMALGIPVLSVLGVVLAAILNAKRLLPAVTLRPNWGLLGGSLMFVGFTVVMGLSALPYNQELIFAGSMGIVVVLMAKLVRELPVAARRPLIGTAIIIFVFRALPGPGAGATWWQIEVLSFDASFLARLSLLSSILALAGMVVLRRFMATQSITFIVSILALVGTALSLPLLGMYYGLHDWAARVTGGVVDARFIAVVDTALELPLGQVAMIPMLAWIANNAPAHLKATFFAVMASFTNLAHSLSQLGSKYLNQLFTITRTDYSELGMLLIVVTVLGLVVPQLAIVLLRYSRWRSA